MNNLRYISELTLKFFSLSLKVNMQYKFDRFMTSFAIFCREMISVIVMFLILSRFVFIRGWNINEMFFLYSFLFISYSIFVFLFTGIREFDNMVRMGDLDRFLTRPLGLFFQVLTAKIDFTAVIGHGAVGLLLFSYTTNSINIQWTVSSASYYLAAVLGGALIQAAIFLLSASFSFWTIKTMNIRNLLFFNTRRFAAYPISFYPLIIQKVLIYVIPFAFVNYFPAQFFLRKGDYSSFKHMAFISPVIGIGLFIITFQIWKFGLRKYNSTGSSYK